MVRGTGYRVGLHALCGFDEGKKYGKRLAVPAKECRVYIASKRMLLKPMIRTTLLGPLIARVHAVRKTGTRRHRPDVRCKGLSASACACPNLLHHKAPSPHAEDRDSVAPGAGHQLSTRRRARASRDGTGWMP